MTTSKIQRQNRGNKQIREPVSVPAHFEVSCAPTRPADTLRFKKKDAYLSFLYQKKNLIFSFFKLLNHNT